MSLKEHFGKAEEGVSKLELRRRSCQQIIARCEASGTVKETGSALKGRIALYLPHLQCGIDIRIFPDVSRLARIFRRLRRPASEF